MVYFAQGLLYILEPFNPHYCPFSHEDLNPGFPLFNKTPLTASKSIKVRGGSLVHKHCFTNHQPAKSSSELQFIRQFFPVPTHEILHAKLWKDSKKFPYFSILIILPARGGPGMRLTLTYIFLLLPK